MTDTPAEVEAARALVAAYDALNSPEHAAEAEKLRELSLKVTARAEAFAAAQAALHAANAGACAAGATPAANTEAAAIINGKSDLDFPEPPRGEFDEDELFETSPEHTGQWPDEFTTPRANGAYTEDSPPPAQAD